MIKNCRFTLLFFVMALLNAQEYRASLLGLVTDSSGAAITNASIKVTNIESGVAATSTTNNEGSYLIPFLIPGRYSLTVENRPDSRPSSGARSSSA